jgi:hypothetical protein
MVVESLVASAITILAPYVATGAKKAAEVAGQAVAEQAGKLLGQIRAWFADDLEASSTLESFEKNPSRYGSAVEDILREKASSNSAIVDGLTQLIDEMGPRIEVVQKIKSLAGEAIGLDIAKWEEGLAASAFQEVERVEKDATLIGAKIGYEKP